jgi:hypothetical protein
MLARIGGRVPILVEIKAGRASVHQLCRAVAEALDSYRGPVAVMSFDARVSCWFAQKRRHLRRGLVFSNRDHLPYTAARQRALAISRARPHFLARDVRDQSLKPLSSNPLPTLFWTVRSNTDRLRARAGRGQIIFERVHG